MRCQHAGSFGNTFAFPVQIENGSLTASINQTRSVVRFTSGSVSRPNTGGAEDEEAASRVLADHVRVRQKVPIQTLPGIDMLYPIAGGWRPCS
jgi:hypothetical protein